MFLRVIILVLLATSIAKGQRSWFCCVFDIIRQPCTDTISYKNKLYSQFKMNKLSHQKLFLYKDKKCIDTVFTDGEGKLCMKLKKGVYQLYLPFKHYKVTPYGNEENFDMTCLKKQWSKPDAIIKKKFHGHIFVNHGIGYVYCPSNYPCLSSSSISDSTSGRH